MDFHKDILLIDLEFSGLDSDRHDILQLAAVLLDRKTLKEKKHFNSLVKPDSSRWKNRDKESMAVNHLSWDELKTAPTLGKVIRDFDKTFGHAVILAAYVGYNDKKFLMAAYRRLKLIWRFDYHYFDIWPVFYAFLAKNNKLKSKKDFAGFGLESMIQYLKLEVPTAMHDALVDCRLEAEVLRKIMAEL